MNDPLAGMRLTGPFFGHLTAAIVKVADQWPPTAGSWR